MRYAEKRVKLPKGMRVGSKVGVVGEGHETFTIVGITRVGERVTEVHISSGWREPLCKIYLLKNGSHSESMADKNNWIDVAIGECDVCGKPFPDSCAYGHDKGVDEMLCIPCYDARKAERAQNETQ